MLTTDQFTYLANLLQQVIDALREVTRDQLPTPAPPADHPTPTHGSSNLGI